MKVILFRIHIDDEHEARCYAAPTVTDVNILFGDDWQRCDRIGEAVLLDAASKTVFATINAEIGEDVAAIQAEEKAMFETLNAESAEEARRS